jgi:hypothetical protein
MPDISKPRIEFQLYRPGRIVWVLDPHGDPDQVVVGVAVAPVYNVLPFVRRVVKSDPR